MEAGRFREDLFYRLHVMPIHIAPLRERVKDIPLLVAHFYERYRIRHGLRPPTLTDDALATLVAYDWPGNVRELGNAVERLMILYPERPVGAAEIAGVLPSARRGEPVPVGDGGSLSEKLEAYERRLIQGALTAADGNIAEAARRLSTDRPNLYRRMKRLGLRREAADER